ncbi:class I SAM-dependent methyltransferase [Sphingomonas sp. ACRSK]|uniref:class I SAM-dependent methyltransferase n=1 Tax=Sphingomonas sp. ACRSK TaxID=2918213 RepID=UPI001EF48D44|nr:class I SAM-dependent methyltransferase [Sphingomonas sp. ACRSK]MCG7348887.1 class I SAM-dependent methyltransferase [Sphingomonas sp. ACRSK]
MLSEAAQRDGAMLGQVVYERREGDFYPTPPENVDCLAHFVDLSGRVIWEPACGEGHISKRLLQLTGTDAVTGAQVYSTDLHHRGYGRGGIDFLRATVTPRRVNTIITNPPFDDLAEAFIRRALALMEPVDGLVAMFLRNEYDCASTKRDDLFEGHPAYATKIVVTKRPRWIEGSKGSPRHNYSWFVWDFADRGAPATIRYIHPRDAAPICPATIN